MRKLLLLAIFLSLHPLWAAITIESGCAAASASGATVSCTTGALSAGDTILVDVTYAGGLATAYTDTVGSTTTSLIPISGSLATSTQPYATGSDSVFYLQNATAGTHTITITFSGTVNYPTLTANGMSGVDAAQSVESYSMVNGSSNNSTLTATAIPAVTPNAAVVAFGQAGSGSVTLSAGSGYTLSTFTSSGNVQSEYAVQTTVGSYAPTFPASATGVPWLVDAVALKAASASGSLSAGSATIPQNTSGNVVNLTCVGCTWTPGTPGSPTFTATGSGVSITAQQVLTSTTATVTLSAGTSTGAFAINDPVTGNSALLSVVPFTACTATDSFSTTGALSPSNWAATTSTGGQYSWDGVSTLSFTTGALAQASGSVTPAALNTLGMALWQGSSCTPPADQTSSLTLTGKPVTSNGGHATGPIVRGSVSGTGYLWILSQSMVMAIDGLNPYRQVVENCSAAAVGHTYQLVARGTYLYGYDDGVLVCKGRDATYTTGSPGILVDWSRYKGAWSSTTTYATSDIVTESGTTYTSNGPDNLNNDPASGSDWTANSGGVDAIGSFSAGSASLLPPTFSYPAGIYGFSPAVVLTNPNAATMCATTDGSTPTALLAGTCTNGATIASGGTITVSASETINAISTKLGLANSSPATVAYTIRSGSPQTWYVDAAIGGPRYSTNQTAGLCDGTVDAAPVGTTPNQHCAFNDVRMLWQDGSYADGTAYPAWGWIGAGGDTYKIIGSIADGVAYRVGWDSLPTYCDTTGCWGLTGNPAGGPPPIPTGGPSNHTQLLGGNSASCSASTARTRLHGGWGVGDVLNMSGSSYVDVACLDITDFSVCGNASQTVGCDTTQDWANVGIVINNLATNDTLTNVNIHGLGGAAILGPTGDGVTMNNVNFMGNASSGWNADLSDGTTGTGSLNVTNFNISWNGCAEEYPIVDPIPYGDCTDAASGGYGDGFGTTTVASYPPWRVHFDQGIASYNTQDGLDALHIAGAGSTMTDTRVLAYGNEGQQLKVGGATATIQNSVIVGNCEAMILGSPIAPPPYNTMTPIPGTPSGFGSKLQSFCRAGDTAVLITTTPGDTTVFQDNTVFEAGAIGVEAEYATFDMGVTNVIQFNNNVFYGFLNVGSGENASPIYGSINLDQFSNPGSSWTNNATFGQRSNWACPHTGESNAICVDPGLIDETYHSFGYGNMAPASASSAVVGAGVPISGITVDYPGNVRSLTAPTIGAFEQTSSSPSLVSIAVTPNPGSLTSIGSTLAMICAATYSDSSTSVCVSPVWTSAAPAKATVNASTGVVTAVATGSSVITATIGSISGSSTVNISAGTTIQFMMGGKVIFSGTVVVQ